MKAHPKYRRRRWLSVVVTAGLVAAGGYLALSKTGVLAQGLFPSSTQSSTAGASTPTVTIQSANVASTAVSASGSLTLVDERSVALGVDGVVEKIAVAVGDQVQAGDLLLQLDTTALERAVSQAQLQVDSAKIALADLQTPATDAEIAKAEATLREAQENLAEVKAGPSAEEIAAARSTLAAAQASYSELQAGPSDAELTQLSADMKKAQIALASAQGAYDKIAWQGSAGMSSEASALQDATIDYESAKAAYEEATAAANSSDLQSAVSTIQDAQVKLNDLLNSPTDAEIAAAEATLASAEASLADLQAGATANDIRSAELTLKEALISLESAQRDLEAAAVTAPVAGYVTALDAEVGVRSSSGTAVAAIADPTQLQLEISVAEADIPNVSMGQAASVEIDALPGKTFAGVINSISPVNDSSSTSVSYPVTIELTSDDLTGVKPGMNAVATLTSSSELSADSWLVPTNALQTSGANTVVTVVRDQQNITVTVTPGSVQGEYTIVTSPDLQANDQVVGSVASQSDQQSGSAGGPPDGGAGAVMGGPPQ
ncbi:MAG: efflux RND transporter periplasmic adaptor subunit [Caldilineaceae bacterium]